MDFSDLLRFCEVDSITSKLVPTEASIYEKICREYSQRFHTPLHQVCTLDPVFVVGQYYSSQLDNVKAKEHIEDLLDTLKKIENPNWEVLKEELLQEEIKRIELAEEERAKKKASKKTLLEKEKLPEGLTSGTVDFSGLKDES